MLKIKERWPRIPRSVTIEPILDFGLDDFVCILRNIAPKFVSIGADSKNSGLPEPEGKKVSTLLSALTKFTHIEKKRNLARLEVE